MQRGGGGSHYTHYKPRLPRKLLLIIITAGQSINSDEDGEEILPSDDLMGNKQASGVEPTNSDLSPGVYLPRDVFPLIFRHSSQATLCACLRVCRAFHYLISTDQVLLARLQVVHSYPQFKRYLEVGRTYYQVEDSGIGQDDDPKFPYAFYRQFLVTKLTRRDQPEMRISFSVVPPPGYTSYSGSKIFSEELMMDGNNVYGVNKFDVMLRLLEKLCRYGKHPNNAVFKVFKAIPFLGIVNKNMRRLLKILKRRFQEDPKFGEFAVLQAGHTEWFRNLMDQPREEEPDTSSDEEQTQEMAEKDVGKVPTYFCKRCKWRVGGFTCQRYAKGVGVCRELLVVDRDGSLRCPKNCGAMYAPLCCRNRQMKAQVDATYTVTASSMDHESGDVSRKAYPGFSCSKCKFAVDGICCFTCTPSGLGVERNNAFLGWRSQYQQIFTCPNGCARRESGLPCDCGSGFIKCKCQEMPNPLAVYGYNKRHGAPRN